jgi:hypothetical protein
MPVLPAYKADQPSLSLHDTKQTGCDADLGGETDEEKDSLARAKVQHDPLKFIYAKRSNSENPQNSGPTNKGDRIIIYLAWPYACKNFKVLNCAHRYASCIYVDPRREHGPFSVATETDKGDVDAKWRCIRGINLSL